MQFNRYFTSEKPFFAIFIDEIYIFFWPVCYVYQNVHCHRFKYKLPGLILKKILPLWKTKCRLQSAQNLQNHSKWAKINGNCFKKEMKSLNFGKDRENCTVSLHVYEAMQVKTTRKTLHCTKCWLCKSFRNDFSVPLMPVACLLLLFGAAKLWYLTGFWLHATTTSSLRTCWTLVHFFFKEKLNLVSLRKFAKNQRTKICLKIYNWKFRTKIFVNIKKKTSIFAFYSIQDGKPIEISRLSKFIWKKCAQKRAIINLDRIFRANIESGCHSWVKWCAKHHTMYQSGKHI